MSDRPETGPMRFGDDWAGVFLRGDNAGPMAFYLGEMLDQIERGEKPAALTIAMMRGLADDLAASNERAGAEVQRMRPFADCVELKR